MDINAIKDSAAVIPVLSFICSMLSASIPEPRTRTGKMFKRMLDFCAVNVGHAKNKGVD